MSDKQYFNEHAVETATRLLNIKGYKKVTVLIHPDSASYAPEGLDFVMCDQLSPGGIRVSGVERTAPWWSEEWSNDGFRSYLKWCAKLSLRIQDTFYQSDFSDKDAGALYDILQNQVRPARQRWMNFSPRMFDEFDWNNELLYFRQLLGRDQDDRTIGQIFHQQSYDTVFAAMCCCFASFLIISRKLTETKSLFEDWANNDWLRIPISIEVLRRQSPEDTTHFPKLACDWTEEMYRELIHRLESSSDPRYAELNALAAYSLNQGADAKRYYEKVYALISSPVKRATYLASVKSPINIDDLSQASELGILQAWNQSQVIFQDNPRGSFVKIIEENVVTKAMLKRAKYRRIDVVRQEIKHTKSSVSLDLNNEKADGSWRKPISEIEFNIDMRNSFRGIRNKVYNHFKQLYKDNRRIRNFTEIYNTYFQIILDDIDIPENIIVAKLVGCSLATVERFRSENREHHWLTFD